MQAKGLPLDFGNLPLGSLYEDRLVEDLLLLVDVVTACRDGDDSRLAELGVAKPAGLLVQCGPVGASASSGAPA